MELRGRFGGVGTLFPPRGSQGLNSGLQALWRCLCPLSYLASPESTFTFRGEILDGGDGSVSSVLATQAGEPRAQSSAPRQQQQGGWVCRSVLLIPVPDLEADPGRSLGLSSQPV